MNVYHLLAIAALALHLAWIVWILLGWLLTRRRPLLRWVHIGSVVYGMLIEIFLWPCPLTLAEQWLMRRAGREPYTGDFLLHYLEAVVYPDVPPLLLAGVAVAVCAGILGIYVRRYLRRTAEGW